MKSYNPSFPIPERLSKLPTFRGFLIPFTVLVSETGHADFRVTDMNRWKQCFSNRLCGLCGEKLEAEIVFIGGDKSVTSGFFFDPPMHEECATYAFNVCPFIAAAKEYSMRPVDAEQVKVNREMPTKRPDKMGMLFCAGYRGVRRRESGEIYYEAIARTRIVWEGQSS